MVLGQNDPQVVLGFSVDKVPKMMSVDIDLVELCCCDVLWLSFLQVTVEFSLFLLDCVLCFPSFSL